MDIVSRARRLSENGKQGSNANISRDTHGYPRNPNHSCFVSSPYPSSHRNCIFFPGENKREREHIPTVPYASTGSSSELSRRRSSGLLASTSSRLPILSYILRTGPAKPIRHTCTRASNVTYVDRISRVGQSVYTSYVNWGSCVRM